MIEIIGDSDEYWFLSEGVELSKDVEGMAIEIGLRRGFGTKTIIDAVKLHCPLRTVVSVDPFGNIPYIGREPDGEVRLDYTNPMRNETMIAMWSYVNDIGVNWLPFIMTDFTFFKVAENGIEINEIVTRFENKYSFAHLDGPHTVAAISHEIFFFNDRMDKGACLVIDDITPDFVDFKPIHQILENLNWQQIKIGNKKALYQKQ